MKQLDKGTILRTIGLIITSLNQIVACIMQFSANTTPYLIISTILEIVMAGVAWWFNNDITTPAKFATAMFDILNADGLKTVSAEISKAYKDHKISQEEALEIAQKVLKEIQE